MSNIYVTEPITKGKLVLHTTVGDLDLELWSKEAPKACRFFLNSKLCISMFWCLHSYEHWRLHHFHVAIDLKSCKWSSVMKNLTRICHLTRIFRNFIQLAMEHYYDDTIFHRISKGFIAQGGDPTGTGFGTICVHNECTDNTQEEKVSMVVLLLMSFIQDSGLVTEESLQWLLLVQTQTKVNSS